MPSERAFDYEHAVWGRERVRPTDRTLAGFRIAELLPALPSRGRVMEWGCGAGRMLGAVRAARPDLSLVGLDLSRAALTAAAERHPQIEFRRCEPGAAALPAADGEFDAVFVLDALEHVDDPERVLAELQRVLAPGGALHLNVPCEGDALSIWRWLPPPARFWKRELGGHLARFRRADVRRLLTDAGFAIERTRYSLHLLGNLADGITFAGLALARRLRPERTITTGDLLATAARDGDARRRGTGGGLLARCVRAVDALLWLEARMLGRWPSWTVHVTARRPGPRPPPVDCRP